MGYGLVGAGAAASGFVEGYEKGRKFIRDEETAEDEKVARGLKIEGMRQAQRKGELDIRAAGLDIKNKELEFDERTRLAGIAKRNQDIDDQIVSLAKEYGLGPDGAKTNQPGRTPPVAAAPVAAAPATPSTTPAQTESPERAPAMAPPPVSSQPSPAQAAPAQAGGIADPASAASEPPQRPSSPAFNDMKRLAAFNQRRLELELERPGANRGEILKQMIDSMKLFDRVQTEQTISIGNRVLAGEDPNKVIADARARGINVPEGTTIKIVDVDVPASRGTQKRKDFEISTPGGAVVSGDALRETLLEPAQVLDYRTKLGKLYGDALHHANTEEIQRQAAKDARDQSERQFRITMARQAESMAIQRAQLGLQQERFKFDKFNADALKTEAHFARLVGYAPLTERDRQAYLDKGDTKGLAAAEQRAAERANLVSFLGSVWVANTDLKTLRQNASPGEVFQAFEALRTTNPKDYKRDDLGRLYVDIGGNKVIMLPLPGSSPSAPARGVAGSPPAPAPQPRLEAADTTRYTRETSPRGAVTWVPNNRGMTKAQWADLDAQKAAANPPAK